MENVNNITEGLRVIEEEIRQLCSQGSNCYESATKIWEISMSLAPESTDLMHPIWLIWAGLTDWHESSPDGGEVEGAIRRAASRWLKIESNDGAAQKDYFDQWIYRELGYENPSKK